MDKRSKRTDSLVRRGKKNHRLPRKYAHTAPIYAALQHSGTKNNALPHGQGAAKPATAGSLNRALKAAGCPQLAAPSALP